MISDNKAEFRKSADDQRLHVRQMRFYVVQRDDTLSGIGRRLHRSWRDLAKINDIPDPDFIKPGQLICY